MLSHAEIERIVEAVIEARKRKPDWLDDPRQTFYSVWDLWFYIAISDDKTCWTCEMLNNQLFTGLDLRGLFPWQQVVTADQILPLVHPNCRCTMLRVTSFDAYLAASAVPPQRFYLGKEVPLR